MRYTVNRTIDFEAAHYDGHGLLSAEVKVAIVEDKNWGADADGNRGMKLRYISEVVVDEIRDFANGVIEMNDELYGEITGEVERLFEKGELG